MKFNVLTLFPEIPKAFFESSIMAKAVQRNLIDYNLVQIRDFAFDKHKTCDDGTYGGGAGMLMLPEPLGRALESVDAGNKRVIYVSPSGRTFNQSLAYELSREKELVFICGRYEGIDQRIIDRYVDDENSIGDYVLSSGETACIVIIDAVYRLVEGVISGESLLEESFSDGLLEYPQYTHPSVWQDRKVPEVLLSGHHANVDKWRREQSLKRTMERRPDMLENAQLNKEDIAFLSKLKKE